MRAPLVPFARPCQSSRLPSRNFQCGTLSRRIGWLKRSHASQDLADWKDIACYSLENALPDQIIVVRAGLSQCPTLDLNAVLGAPRLHESSRQKSILRLHARGQRHLGVSPEGFP